MMKIDRSHILYQKAAAVKDRIITFACSAGLVTDPQTIDLDGYQADFRVTTAAEHWRVRQQMRETDVLLEILSEISPGDCFWDVGAAVGTYSCLVADAGADSIAFEPHPKNHERCQENFKLNNVNTPTYRFALSDKQDVLKFSSGSNVGEGTHQLQESGEITVKTIRGDEVNAPQPDVIKIDVEGHELRVLRGMKETLSMARAVFVECHPNHGIDVNVIHDFFKNYDFTVEVINLNRVEPYVVARSNKI